MVGHAEWPHTSLNALHHPPYVLLDFPVPEGLTSDEAVELLRQQVRQGDVVFHLEGHVVIAVAGGWPEATAVSRRLGGGDWVPHLIEDHRTAVIPDVVIDVRTRDQGPGDAGTVNVLVIDDDAHLRLTLRRLMWYEGWAVSEAGSAEDGLELLGTHHLDVIVCDMVLPGMRGIELLQLLRARKSDVPFVLFSGSITYSERTTASRLGAAVVDKPNAHRLVHLVRERLRAPV